MQAAGAAGRRRVEGNVCPAARQKAGFVPQPGEGQTNRARFSRHCLMSLLQVPCGACLYGAHVLGPPLFFFFTGSGIGGAARAFSAQQAAHQPSAAMESGSGEWLWLVRNFKTLPASNKRRVGCGSGRVLGNAELSGGELRPRAGRLSENQDARHGGSHQPVVVSR